MKALDFDHLLVQITNKIRISKVILAKLLSERVLYM